MQQQRAPYWGEDGVCIRDVQIEKFSNLNNLKLYYIYNFELWTKLWTRYSRLTYETLNYKQTLNCIQNNSSSAYGGYLTYNFILKNEGSILTL
jgi:hypothetical protein